MINWFTACCKTNTATVSCLTEYFNCEDTGLGCEIQICLHDSEVLSFRHHRMGCHFVIVSVKRVKLLNLPG